MLRRTIYQSGKLLAEGYELSKEPLPTTRRTPRDLRIDFLRGVFILSLGGSHFAWFAHVAGYRYWLRYYDIQPFGFSSPAEFFVFFSGYVMALVLARQYDASGFFLTFARLLDRSWSLYILNIFTLAVAIALSSALFARSPALQDISGISHFTSDPVGFIMRFLVFRDKLMFFEILRNYIFFLPLIAPFLWLAKRNVYLPIGISGAVWLADQIILWRYIPYGTFNPLAWQLVFFLGATFAIVRPLTGWTFPLRRRQIVICISLLFLAFLARVTLFSHIANEAVPFAQKRDVGPLRLMHFGLLMWTSMLLVPVSQTLERSRLVRGIIKVGQNSLECFCMSSLLAYSGAGVVSMAPKSVLLYWAVVLSILALLLLGAQTASWFKSEPWTMKRPSSTNP
jgi:hypothetical protein